MNKENLVRLLNEYKETEKCLNLGLEWLNDNEYAKGKLDLVKTIIADLEKLSREA